MFKWTVSLGPKWKLKLFHQDRSRKWNSFIGTDWKSETVSLAPNLKTKQFHQDRNKNWNSFIETLSKNETVWSIPLDDFRNCFNWPPPILHRSFSYMYVKIRVLIWFCLNQRNLTYFQYFFRKSKNDLKWPFGVKFLTTWWSFNLNKMIMHTKRDRMIPISPWF